MKYEKPQLNEVAAAAAIVLGANTANPDNTGGGPLLGEEIVGLDD
jgi:hypothetical protein